MTKTSCQSNVHTTDWYDSFMPNYNAMKRAMLEAKRQIKKAYHAASLFMADIQLCRVGLNVKWAYPELFGDYFFLRLGEKQFLWAMLLVWRFWCLNVGWKS